MKKINKDLNYIDIISSNEESILEIELRESTQFQIGQLSLLIQYVLTSSRNNILKVKLNIKIEEIDRFLQFNGDFLFWTLILFKKKIDIYDINGENLKLYINDYFFKIVDNIKQQERLQYLTEQSSTLKGELNKVTLSNHSINKNKNGVTFLISCFDHLKDLDLNRSAYFNNRNSFKTFDEIKVWLNKLFSFYGLELTKTTKDNDFIKDMSIVMKELFQNTEDWAVEKFDGGSYEENYRGCLVNIYLENKFSSLENKKDGDLINNYIKEVFSKGQSNIFIPNNQLSVLGIETQSIGICEISVVDTGPGMARRWLKKDFSKMSFEEQYDSVINCFHKHVTSDKSSRMHGRGKGLTRVLNTIGKAGFLSLRTGSVYIQRNFLINNIKKEEVENNDISFDLKLNNLYNIDGTSITILYPFLYNKK